MGKPVTDGLKTKPDATNGGDLAAIVESFRDLGLKTKPDATDGSDFAAIVESFRDLDLSSPSGMSVLSSWIYEKMQSHPHRVEFFATLVSVLASHLEGIVVNDNSGKTEFMRAFMDETQAQYENCPENCSLINLKFMGHLFLHKIMPAKIIFNVAFGLVKNLPAAESDIEKVCALLDIIGPECMKAPETASMLDSIMFRLDEINTGNAGHNERIIALIDKLVDLRDNN